MTFTRLTVVGATRRADLVVPDDEPFAALLPDMLDLLGEASEFDGAPVRLVRRTGAQIELAATPAELAVPNGDVLRIVRAEDAPPPPEVADVTDVVAEALERRADRWGLRPRLWTGAAVVVVASSLLGLALRDALDRGAVIAFAAAWVVSLCASVIFGRLSWQWTRMWTTAAAVGLSVPLAAAIAAEVADVSVVLAGAVLVWAAVGIGLGVAARFPPPAWAGLAGAAAAGAWLILSATTLPPVAVPAIVGIAALIAIGVLPSIALATSGLSDLDDAAIAGALPARRAVATSLDDAYAALAWLAAALALTAAAAGVVLATSGDLYGVLLAVALALVLALRTRQFPLVVHVVPLWAAALAVAVAIAMSPLLSPAGGAAVLGAAGVLAVVLVGMRPSPHARVRLRRWGNLLELLAVVATVPLLLGALQVYPDLLRVFP